MIRFYINCFADPKKNELKYQIVNDRGKEVGHVCFGRDRMEEKLKPYVRMLEWMQKKRKQPEISVAFRKVLRKEERDIVQKIFPYIPVYRNMWEFLHLYEQHNAAADFDTYERWKEIGKSILEKDSENSSGAWKVLQTGETKTVLYCKWKNASGTHIVLADDKMFYSDAAFGDICKAEYVFGKCSKADLDIFMKDHPDSMLDVYIEKGGKRVLYYLTSSRNDHLFELLVKSGLAELADHSDEYRGLDRKGNNIPKIFQLPVRCLRSFHGGNDLMLYDREDRQVVKWVYERCPDLFQDPFSVMKELWFRYCYQYHDLQVHDGKKLEDILRASTRYLERQTERNGNPYVVFGLYENYLRYSIRIGNFFYGLYPKDLEKAVDTCVEYLQKQYEAIKENAFHEAVCSEDYEFLEENLEFEPYRISAPQSAEQLVEASVVLNNCLNNYVSKIRRQQTMVGLLYEKEKNTLIGAIEVKDRIMVQAKGPFNGRLKPSEEEYIRRYKYRKQVA